VALLGGKATFHMLKRVDTLRKVRSHRFDIWACFLFWEPIMDENLGQLVGALVKSLVTSDLGLLGDDIEKLPSDWLPKMVTAIATMLEGAPVGVRPPELIDWATTLSTKKDKVRVFRDTMDDLAVELGLVKANFEAAAKYMLFSDTSPEGFFVKDLSNKYAFVNQAMANLLERRKSEIIGRGDKDLYGEEAAVESDQAFASALKGDIIRADRIRLINGKTKTFLEIVFAKQDANNEPVGVFGICRDITGLRTVPQYSDIEDKRFSSVAMRKILRKSLQAAQIGSIVLLTGESGSGKDWLARYIYEHSLRSGKPYFSINCAAIPGEMAESELFGHEKGAFTGASGRKRGQLELAGEGTLLLNEIGELPLGLQSKLLQFLDTSSFTRVGGEKTIKVNARLIAATNRDLAKEVREGRFRRDLFYRLNVFQIRMPALRERTEDIPTLVHELLTKLADNMKLPSLTEIDAEAMEKLRHYGWPGNVRELRNVLERAIIKSHGNTITVDEIDFSSEEEASPQTEASIQPILRPLSRLTNRELKQMYEEACVGVDEETGNRLAEPGSLKAMATVTGRSTKTLRRKLNDSGRDPVDEGRPGEKAMEDLIRRLETWLTRHGFKCERASD
jgi:two-component system, NtrC family, response regulator AtoC